MWPRPKLIAPSTLCFAAAACYVSCLSIGIKKGRYVGRSETDHLSTDRLDVLSPVTSFNQLGSYDLSFPAQP